MFSSFFGVLQHDLDMESTDLPKVIRCSADRMSETGVYLLGEYLSFTEPWLNSFPQRKWFYLAFSKHEARAKAHKNSLPSAVKHKTRANRVKILYQARENTKPVPSSGKWHKISLTIQANFFLLVNVHLLLTENGISLFMWIGLQVDPSWLNQVFGAHTIGQVDIEMVRFYLKSHICKKKKKLNTWKELQGKTIVQ